MGAHCRNSTILYGFAAHWTRGCESLSLTVHRWGKISTSIVDPMGRA